MLDSDKMIFKSTLKRRIIEILISIPFGIGFATLFWYINLSNSLTIFLTVVCWGTTIVLIELVFVLIKKFIEKKNIGKPKKRDPFADK